MHHLPLPEAMCRPVDLRSLPIDAMVGGEGEQIFHLQPL